MSDALLSPTGAPRPVKHECSASTYELEDFETTSASAVTEDNDAEPRDRLTVIHPSRASSSASQSHSNNVGLDHNEFELVDDWIWKPTDFHFSQRIPIESLKKQKLGDVFADIKQSFMSVVLEREHHLVWGLLDLLGATEKFERRQQPDLARIANTLGAFLKRHCAPIQDDAVDMMVSKVRHEDPPSMVAGLFDLSGLLTTMKIDIANHQIRPLREKSLGDSYFVPGYRISRVSEIRCFCGPDATVRPHVFHVC